ncbi:MAG: DUF368 domain-containing protein [Fuerstiella sp.]
MNDVVSENAERPRQSDGVSDNLPKDGIIRVPLSVHARIVGCGFLMGAADSVPGVSGGTVALILGVYERLVAAIGRCDLKLLSLISERRWKEAAGRMDLVFVLALGTGILTGIVGLASLMNYLLSSQMSLTFAAFSGMIMASSLLVARRIDRWRLQHTGILILGIVFALRVVTLPALQNPPDTLWYMFVCGAIGITAMILPGISGAFILLLMGRYHDIMESIRGIFFHGDISVQVILSLGVFALGCLTGLLGFSRILRWLLTRYHDPTMAVLCGFMVGSLYKLWPFQQDMTPDVVKFKHKTFAPVMPEAISGQFWAAVVLCVLGVSVVLTLDRVAHRRRPADQP